jgi:tetratricopeptide (TPR) repeat protein
MRGLAAFALCAALVGPTLALAQTTPTPGDQAAAPKYAPTLPEVSPEAPAVAAAGAREVSTGDPDEDATLAAIADFQANGMAGLGEHETALRKVLADMPRPFLREQVDGGKVVYRGDSMADCLAFATTRGAGPKSALVCKGNPYAVAGFYLGSYLNETGRYDEALAALNLGLEAAPNSPGLISERNAAFFGLHRFDDALASARRGLEIANLAPEDHARLLRNLGNALTELKRLDEAEQAYRDSLKLEPGNALALNELRYIAQLRRGGPAEPGVVFRPNASASQTLP